MQRVQPSCQAFRVKAQCTKREIPGAKQDVACSSEEISALESGLLGLAPEVSAFNSGVGVDGAGPAAARGLGGRSSFPA